MAKFIGSDLHTGNWGEDYFIEKLMEYLDDTYVIYRNRPIFGAQFDVALLRQEWESLYLRSKRGNPTQSNVLKTEIPLL